MLYNHCFMKILIWVWIFFKKYKYDDFEHFGFRSWLTIMRYASVS